MSTGIAWTDETNNFWHGCKTVSPGCRNCYMFRDKARYGQDATIVTRSKPATFRKARKWADPKLIFTCSWSDFFIAQADEWRADAWAEIRACPQHQWQILTKRTNRIAECLPPDWGPQGYPNVWLGASIEGPEQLHRAEELLRVPAAVHFLSLEPLIKPVDLGSNLLDKARYGELGTIDWVIIGGESGNEEGMYKYRPMELRWMEAAMEQCRANKVPVFVKQLGTYQAKRLKLGDYAGANPNAWPVEYRIQEWPRYMEAYRAGYRARQTGLNLQ